MINSSGLAPAEDIRRRVVAALRNPAAIARMAPGELDLTLRVMRRAQLLARLAWQLSAAGVTEQLPGPARDALAGALQITEARARDARWELDRILWALRNDSDVPIVAVKG